MLKSEINLFVGQDFVSGLFALYGNVQGLGFLRGYKVNHAMH